MNDKKGNKKVGCLSLLLILVLFVAIFAIIGSGGDDTETKKKSKEDATTEKKIDWTVAHNDDDHMATYVTILQEGVDKYVNGVDWPWSFDAYKFVDYDDTKSGCIVGFTDPIGIDGVVEKQAMTVIFTIDPDGEHYQINSVVVGDTTFQDDGKMQDIVNKLNGE